MPDFDFDIAVLGGGSAGLTIAAGAAQFGAKTLLIEKEGRLGGDCLHYGCVPSKTLIRTASVRQMIKNSAKFGLPQVQALPVDFREVSARIRSVIAIIQHHDSPERFCKLGVKVEFGHAEFVDEHSVRLEGKTYSARNWVIATGSSPSVPAIPGIETTPFITNREIFYLEKLPRSMIILGGGPISTEMAQAFARLGSEVTVVQRGSQILTREDKDMADAVMEVMRAEGVAFHLNAGIEGVRELREKREVVIRKKEGSPEKLIADTILVALGREANLRDLGLEKIGVEFDRQGLNLDSRLRTTQPHIFGAGDVTGGYQFTHAAGYEAGIVLSNALLRLPRKTDYTWLPWCTYTDPELASIGMNELRAQEAGIAHSIWTEEFRMNDRSLAEGSATGKIKLILNEKEKPIGVQILGIHAGELISEWVAVLNSGMRLSSLAGAVHPYPTIAEINKKVAGNFISEKLFSGKMKKALKLFFNLKGRACE